MGKSIEKQGNMIIKAKAKVLKLNVNESVIDGNSVSIPFIAEYKGDRLTMIEYEWNTKDKVGNPIKRGISVSGHGEYGVPTLKEKEVLGALERIFINKKIKNGVCELKMFEVADDDLTIDFTLTELARELGYKSPNSNVLSNLKKSIKILVATTISNLYEGGIYDNRTKEYIKNPEVSFHLLESTIGYTKVDKKGKEEDVTKIRISKFTYDMIVNDYMLYYKTDINDKTKNLLARSIYKLALQWKGSNTYSWCTIDTLIERFPMQQKEKKHKKQHIKKALKVLDESGVVKVDIDDNDKVLFNFNFKNKLITDHSEIDILDLKNKYITYKDTFNGLENDIKMGRQMAYEFLDNNIEDIRYIQALLRYCYARSRSTTIKNIDKYFIKCFDEKYTLEDRYYRN